MKPTLISLVLLAVVNGCGGSEGQQVSTMPLPPVGTDCTVCLRRDALGAPNRIWLDPLTENIDGTQIAVSGKFVAADHDWVTLDTHPAPNHGVPVRVWLARESVLAIAQTK